MKIGKKLPCVYEQSIHFVIDPLYIDLENFNRLGEPKLTGTHCSGVVKGLPSRALPPMPLCMVHLRQPLPSLPKIVHGRKLGMKQALK